MHYIRIYLMHYYLEQNSKCVTLNEKLREYVRQHELIAKLDRVRVAQ